MFKNLIFRSIKIKCSITWHRNEFKQAQKSNLQHYYRQNYYHYTFPSPGGGMML